MSVRGGAELKWQKFPCVSMSESEKRHCNRQQNSIEAEVHSKKRGNILASWETASWILSSLLNFNLKPLKAIVESGKS